MTAMRTKLVRIAAKSGSRGKRACTREPRNCQQCAVQDADAPKQRIKSAGSGPLRPKRRAGVATNQARSPATHVTRPVPASCTSHSRGDTQQETGPKARTSTMASTPRSAAAGAIARAADRWTIPGVRNRDVEEIRKDTRLPLGLQYNCRARRGQLRQACVARSRPSRQRSWRNPRGALGQPPTAPVALRAA